MATVHSLHDRVLPFVTELGNEDRHHAFKLYLEQERGLFDALERARTTKPEA